MNLYAQVARLSVLGPLLSVARAAGSGVADSVQGILIHSVDDPTPGWDGGSRGIARRGATRKAVLGCLAERIRIP